MHTQAMTDTRVDSLRVWWGGPQPARIPQQYHSLLPKATRPLWVEVELAAPLAYASAIRRVALEELPGLALGIATDSEFKTNDQHYRVDIDRNLRLLPLDLTGLDAQEAAGVRYELAAQNDSAAWVPLTAAALRLRKDSQGGQNRPPLFNSSAVIGPPLQPGGYLAIDDIRVTSGIGRVIGNPAAAAELDPIRATLGHPGWSGACRVSLVPLDIDPNAVSSLVGNPRRHRLRLKLKAVGGAADPAAAAQRYLIRACVSLRERLAAVGRSVRAESDTEITGGPGALRATGNVAVIEIPGETDSVGQILATAILEVEPGVEFAGAAAIIHEGLIKVTIRHAEPDELASIAESAIEHAIATIERLEQNFRGARVEILGAAPASKDWPIPEPKAFA